MTAEEWRPCVGFAGYFVSDQGRVASEKRGEPRALRPWTDKDGYQLVALYRDSKRCPRTIHSLVAEAFLGPRPKDNFQVRHLNGNPGQNVVSNLLWGSSSENRMDCVRHGTHSNARKKQCPRSHAYDEANTRWSQGKRHCRSCDRFWNARRGLAAANVRSAAA